MSAGEIDWAGAHPALIEAARHIPISLSNMQQFVIPRIAGTADTLSPIATVQLALAAVDYINTKYFSFEATAEGAAARSLTHEWLETRPKPLKPGRRSVSDEALRIAESAALATGAALRTQPAVDAVGSAVAALRAALATDAGDDALATQQAVDAVALALDAPRSYYQALAPQAALEILAKERPRGPFGRARRRAEIEKKCVSEAALSAARGMLNGMLIAVGLPEVGYAVSKRDARRETSQDRRDRKLGDLYGYCPKCGRAQNKVSRAQGKCFYDNEPLLPE